MPITVVVTNRKGGAGKTTVSINLAAELAALGRRVLLVDLDSQSHCALGLGISGWPSPEDRADSHIFAEYVSPAHAFGRGRFPGAPNRR